MFHHLVCQTLDFSDKNICLYKLESPNSGSFKVWVLIIFFALSELPQWNESLNERLPHILFIVQIVIYWIRHLLHFVPAIVSISKQLWIYTITEDSIHFANSSEPCDYYTFWWVEIFYLFLSSCISLPLPIYFQFPSVIEITLQ